MRFSALVLAMLSLSLAPNFVRGPKQNPVSVPPGVFGLTPKNAPPSPHAPASPPGFRKGRSPFWGVEGGKAPPARSALGVVRGAKPPY